jgi:uncharacterized membrane protein YfcA
MEIIGYIASIFIGITLGLIGGGGSILTVPVLVYLFGVDVVAATAYSLFIVGISSVVGSVTYFKNKLVSIKTAIVFGIPSIISVYLTRAYIVPAIPEHILNIGDLEITKGIMLMVLFAVLMIFASYSMIKVCKNCKDEDENAPDEQSFNYPVILLEGLIVGVLTGLVGAGGGFLIIPALVLLSKLKIKKAIGTSLVIIAAKSLIGFLGENPSTGIDWGFLILVSLFSIAGIFIGMLVSKKISGGKLKPIFGWFVLVMGIFILIKELFFN